MNDFRRLVLKGQQVLSRATAKGLGQKGQPAIGVDFADERIIEVSKLLDIIPIDPQHFVAGFTRLVVLIQLPRRIASRMTR